MSLAFGKRRLEDSHEYKVEWSCMWVPSQSELQGRSLSDPPRVWIKSKWGHRQNNDKTKNKGKKNPPKRKHSWVTVVPMSCPYSWQLKVLPYFQIKLVNSNKKNVDSSHPTCLYPPVVGSWILVILGDPCQSMKIRLKFYRMTLSVPKALFVSFLATWHMLWSSEKKKSQLR